ncbi:hypothetical protein BC936DRAFT_147546 [Jimgerdemannia flammicorona]|uniref:Uncharacterized protein n=1 Tax=Jimgerdemannia flammicorona TaxID=994334 RepID=A0A433D534_9FUNG|nr:hypothetical protein BC936DRAFT_147546 [Jimgerdemannia flammicorona]
MCHLALRRPLHMYISRLLLMGSQSQYKKSTSVNHCRILVSSLATDFENLDAHREAFRGVNYVFSALGINRIVAGSAENFKRIDHKHC